MASSQPIIHLVYPHGDAISCPDAIGRKLGERLEHSWLVEYHDWDGHERIEPAEGDILIGHPHPSPRTTFRISAECDRWRRVIMLNPFNLDLRQVAWIDQPIRKSDLYLAITGNYWFSRITRSPVKHWLPKMVHVDLAVDRNDYPRIKREFAEPGRRRFLYIGHSGWQKNPQYLEDLARRLKAHDFGWIGTGKREIRGFRAHGLLDFRHEDAKAVVAQYDFLLTASLTDSNPATILEAMAWGLVPICTPQSGYAGYAGIVNIPGDDPDSAAGILARLQTADTKALEYLRASNDRELVRHFNWERFAGQVIEAIESDLAPVLGPQSCASRLHLLTGRLTSPYSLFQAQTVARIVRRTGATIASTVVGKAR